MRLQMNESQWRCPIFQRQTHFTAVCSVYLVRSELMGSAIRFYTHSEFATVVYLGCLLQMHLCHCPMSERTNS